MADKKKIGGIPAAILIFFIGIVVLWWNEGNNVKNIKAVAEARKNVTQVSSQMIDEAYEGKLIATNGKMDVLSDALTDDTFDVTIKTAKLVRVAEMYQWEEDENEDSDGDTTYSYSKTWSDRIINSKSFHNSEDYVNPENMPYENTEKLAEEVAVGAFRLTSQQIARLSTQETFTDLSDEVAQTRALRRDGNYYTTSEDLSKPEIGDIRVSFKYNNSTEVSLLGEQSGNTVIDYLTKSGKTFNVISDGRKTAEVMINEIESSNNMLKWILRFAGIFMLIIGIGGVLSPISKLTSYVPILGKVVGSAIGVFSFLLGLAIGLFVIAIAWIRFRPLLGIGLLVLVGALVFVIIKLRNKNAVENVTE
ncbi:MAG: TMEM43 family protein [Clostridia bacterium]|nr:TMEM43 family protein [Clostridia bacterium]